MHQWAFGNHTHKKLIEQTFFNKYTNFIPELQRIVTPESTICKKEQDIHQKDRTKRSEDHLQAGFTTSHVVRGVISLPCGGCRRAGLHTEWL